MLVDQFLFCTQKLSQKIQFELPDFSLRTHKLTQKNWGDPFTGLFHSVSEAYEIVAPFTGLFHSVSEANGIEAPFTGLFQSVTEAYESPVPVTRFFTTYQILRN